MDAVAWTLMVYLITPTTMQTEEVRFYYTLEECMVAANDVVQNNKDRTRSYVTSCSALYPQEKLEIELDETTPSN